MRDGANNRNSRDPDPESADGAARMSEERDGIDGQRWWLDAHGAVQHEPASQELLAAMRQEASGKEKATRSCWQCNGAHTHFLSDEWGDWVCWCLWGCGRFYYKGVDLTVWDDATVQEPEQP